MFITSAVSNISQNYNYYSLELEQLPTVLKGRGQLWDRAGLDTTFASLKIKSTRPIHLEIRFNPT